jgi:hypothetical protein
MIALVNQIVWIELKIQDIYNFYLYIDSKILF